LYALLRGRILFASVAVETTVDATAGISCPGLIELNEKGEVGFWFLVYCWHVIYVFEYFRYGGDEVEIKV